MGDIFGLVADPIKELVFLNRGESAPTLYTLTAIEAEGRSSKRRKSTRKRAGHDLVQVLGHRDGKKR